MTVKEYETITQNKHISDQDSEVETIDDILAQNLLAATKNKNGKLSPLSRIKILLDKDSTFLELSNTAGYNLYPEYTPSGSIITGIGKVANRFCMIICNNYNIKGGSYFPITIKKHLRAQEIAETCGLPCIYLVDSAGAYLPMQAEIFADKEHFGKIFFNEARMSAKGLPQIAVVLGACTAGGAYIPAMADETIMVEKQAAIFLAGPSLLKAATGEKTDAETLGGTDMHCSKSGLADYAACDEEEAFAIARKVIATLPESFIAAGKNSLFDKNTHQHPAPKFDPAEILDLINGDDKQHYDARELIKRIVDDSDLHEFKPLYGTTLVCGFAKIHSHKIAIIANNGVLFSESAQKSTHFIQLCNQRKIPILFLQNITGFMVGKHYESTGIAKYGACLLSAIATSIVPKITIIIGGSYGAGNYAMCGRSFHPNFLWSWPNSKMSIMGSEQAASVLNQLKMQKIPYTELAEKHNPSLYKDQIKAQYQKESSAFYTSARLMDDGIISPLDTRYYVGRCLEILQNYNYASYQGTVSRI
tara:strand:+ start:2198 stop:3793 length:1596 start_codon:yes stop_codon:yes gene_type:complete